MGDEIANANVIRVVQDNGYWIATIGPDPQIGLLGVATTPIQAMINLTVQCARQRWPFDPTWQPGKTHLHEV